MIIIISTLLILYSSCEISIDNGLYYEDDSYSMPTAFTLLNGKIIMINSIGIFLYDSELENGTLIVNQNFELTDIRNCIFKQFSYYNDGYIMIIIKKIIYIFKKQGILFYQFDLSTFYDNTKYKLIPYKKENNNLYYILCGLTNAIINLYFFEFNLDNKINTKISNIDYSIYLKHNTRNVGDFDCLMTKYPNNDEEEILTCLYTLSNQGKFIHSISFKPENNFTELEDYHITKKLKELTKMIFLSLNEDKSKIFTISISASYVEYVIFDINKKIFRIIL